MKAATRIALAIGAAAALGAGAGAARAAPPTPARVGLAVERAAGLEACPDAAAMRELIAARLGYDPVVDGAEPVFVVSFAPDPPGLRATLERRQASERRGSRTLRSETGDCAELASSVALAAALAIDPDAKPAPAPAPPPVSAPPAPPPPPPPPPKPAPTPSASPPAARPAAPPEPETPTRLAVGVGPVLGAGHVPGISAGPRLDVALRHGAFSLELQGTALVDGSERVAAGDVSASAFFASLLPCLRWTASADWSGDVCAEAQVGGLFASAEGVDRSEPTTEVLGAAGPRASVELAFGPHVAGRVSASVVAQLRRVHLEIDDAGTPVEVWATPPIAFLVGVEPLLLLP